MKLRFVEMTGFRGFRDRIRFEFPNGFAVLTGRNGAGKSTVLDAIDYALTGTINKFQFKGHKGAGVQEHIWWVGSGQPEAHSVSVGFADEQGEPFVVTRTREEGADVETPEIIRHLCSNGAAARVSVENLLQTTLIRDEFIAGLSLDLPEQARFTLVRDAIGKLVGPDYSGRAAAIVSAANAARQKQDGRVKDLQNELGRLLGELTEARSAADRSSDVGEALRYIESQSINLPEDLTERSAVLRDLVARRRASMGEIERARSLSQQLLPEFGFFNSPTAEAELESARSAWEAATREKTVADEKFRLAVAAEQAERESDEFAAHISELLEHGSAVGLQDGHCPLCDAVRTSQEFLQAISQARARLATRGEKLAATTRGVADTKRALEAAHLAETAAEGLLNQLAERRAEFERRRARIVETYGRLQFSASPDDPISAERALFAEQDNLVKLERALAVLETSTAIDRVKILESRIAALRQQIDEEALRLSSAAHAAEAARQIENATKTVANQILTEQFDTVMPLLKELYKRLRPHTDWTEIDSDFGGKVRGSLNLVVGEGHNPQFLFSSGQRRAAGLAFLLAVHLSRPWCRWDSLLLDDPVQHIDDYRAINLVEVLAAIRRGNRQVIVAVEDSALADLLCRRLRSTTSELGRVFEVRTSKSGAAEIGTARDVYPMPQLVLRSA
jgi:DNA repair exonuclease SbcCD ATPase subunit